MSQVGPTADDAAPSSDDATSTGAHADLVLPGGRVPPRRTARRLALAAAALVSLAMLLPAVLDRDDYPLSSYPMFSHPRARTSTVATAVGRTAEGGVVRLSPELIAGSDQPMQAIATVARAVRAGSGPAALLCEEVARRVAGTGADEVVAIEVRRETHDAVDYFTGGDRRPSAVDTVARCTLP